MGKEGLIGTIASLIGGFVLGFLVGGNTFGAIPINIRYFLLVAIGAIIALAGIYYGYRIKEG